jgi:polyisoprenoid-binding protein YceI
MKNILLILMAFFVQGIAFGQVTWQQTSGSVSFDIKNRGSKVNGHFGDLHTTLVFSPDKLAASSLKGYVAVSTINTGIDKRDKDLQGETYFDADKHKLIEVSSTKLVKNGSQYSGTFNVTIKGVTKQVEMPFQFIQNGNTAEFKGSCTINRKDYGVGGESGLAFFMSDDAHVNIDILAKK